MQVGTVNEYARYARDLDRAADSLTGDGEVIADKVARGALATAQARAPVDKGELRAGLHITLRGEMSMVSGSTDHDAYVEYGTSDTAPQPFIGPAFEQWAPRLVTEVERVRDETVRSLG